jgi:hypothetical protein
MSAVPAGVAEPAREGGRVDILYRLFRFCEFSELQFNGCGYRGCVRNDRERPNGIAN